jgi:hypothetical protein
LRLGLRPQDLDYEGDAVEGKASDGVCWIEETGACGDTSARPQQAALLR